MRRRSSNQPTGQGAPITNQASDPPGSGRAGSPLPATITCPDAIASGSLGAGPAARRGLRALPALVCLLLAVITLAVFWPVTGFDFINLDDTSYVTENVQVQSGLSWEGLRWAFTNLNIGLWHPLTWVSHMLDCQWHGPRPGGHHLTSLLLHVANTLLLFVGLRRITGALWRPALVAALFALHPLHVESVAWVAERKDVLSTFFVLLTLGAYVRYAQGKAENRKQKAETGGPFLSSDLQPLPSPSSRGPVVLSSCLPRPLSSGHYWLSLLFFGCALMSKPMVITLPLLLLLLDYWPLCRFQLSTINSRHPAIRLLLLEKLPFAMAALLTGWITLEVAARQGSLPSGLQCPLSARMANATISYARYFLQTFWPGDLAVFYPFPATFSVWCVVGAGLLLAGISVTAGCLVRRRPYVAVGWLWYLVTLLPVIGLIQLAGYSHADRYTYVPLIGVFLLLAWGAHDLTRHWRHQAIIASAASAAGILLCVALTRQQLGYWQNSETLFRHALACTSNNFVAHHCLGLVSTAQARWTEASQHFELALEANPGWAEARYGLGWVSAAQGKWNDAIQQYELALESNPRLAKVHGNLALALARQGRWEEAIPHCELALESNPNLAEVHYCLGLALAAQGNSTEAIPHFEQAVQLRPGFAEAHSNLAAALLGQRKWDEAVQHGQLALQANPGLAEAHFNLAKAFCAQGRWQAAIPHLEQVLKSDPNSARAHNTLGLALARTGQWAEAIVHYQQALAIQPEAIPFRNNLARLLATCPKPELRNGVKAVDLAQEVNRLSGEKDPLYLDTLAAAYAEAGQFPEPWKPPSAPWPWPWRNPMPMSKRFVPGSSSTRRASRTMSQHRLLTTDHGTTKGTTPRANG